MADLLLWLYLANSVLLINHEIDSAYWKEWDLFQTSRRHYGFLINPFSAVAFYSLRIDPCFQAFRIRSHFFIHSLFRWHFCFCYPYIFSQ